MESFYQMDFDYDLLWTVNHGYGTAIPSGWLIALPYLRNNAHVRLIVPSKMGTYNCTTICQSLFL